MLRTVLLALLAIGFLTPALSAADNAKKKKKKAEPQIGHMVYFKLKDSTPETRTKLVEACKKYLEKHEGVVYFAAGPRGEEFKRDVNDQDWDVGLHLVFANKAAHDKYQDHPEHLKFIEENKETWAKVRVFDSECQPTSKKAKKTKTAK